MLCYGAALLLYSEVSKKKMTCRYYFCDYVYKYVICSIMFTVNAQNDHSMSPWTSMVQEQVPHVLIHSRKINMVHRILNVMPQFWHCGRWCLLQKEVIIFKFSDHRGQATGILGSWQSNMYYLVQYVTITFNPFIVRFLLKYFCLPGWVFAAS